VVGQYLWGYESNFDIKFLSGWGQILLQLWANYAFFYNLCISDDRKPFTCHRKIFAVLYSVTYSFMFLVTFVWVCWGDRKYNYYDIATNIGYTLVIYLPFSWEYIIITWCHVIPVSVIGFGYLGFNAFQVRVKGETIYEFLDWKDGHTILYSIVGFLVLITGFFIGWVFSRIILHAPKKSKKVAPETPDAGFPEIQDAGNKDSTPSATKQISRPITATTLGHLQGGVLLTDRSQVLEGLEK
jgi:hypothetical protein